MCPVQSVTYLSGLTKDNAQQLMHDYRFDFPPETIEKVVDAVGVRTKPLSHGLPVLQHTLRKKVEALFQQNNIQANEDDILDYTWMALNRGGGEHIHPDVIKVFECQYNIKKHRVPNPEGKSAMQWALEQRVKTKTKEELAAEARGARLHQLRTDPGEAMRFLAGGTEYVDPAVTGNAFVNTP